jgi:hypothetical protein
MIRDHIISEIQRAARANGGVPLGRLRFERETGIPRHAWYGKHWTSWSQAVRDAGFQPNKLQAAHPPSLLIEKLVALTRRLGRLPISADLLFARNHDSTFPCRDAFIRRLGSKSERAARVLEFCQKNAGYDDVAAIWRALATVDSEPATGSGSAPLPSPGTSYGGAPWLPSSPLTSGAGGPSVRGPAPDDASRSPLPGPRSPVNQSPSAATTDTNLPTATGYVYLLKYGRGRDYKIGRTRNPLRREGQVALELPDELEPIHYIKTDDPRGIESYWHARFRTKRKRGEWFALTADDVRAFKRWKRIH